MNFVFILGGDAVLKGGRWSTYNTHSSEFLETDLHTFASIPEHWKLTFKMYFC